MLRNFFRRAKELLTGGESETTPAVEPEVAPAPVAPPVAPPAAPTAVAPPAAAPAPAPTPAPPAPTPPPVRTVAPAPAPRPAKLLDEDFFDDLEAALIQADIGAETAEKLVTAVRTKATAERTSDPEVVQGFLRDAVAEILERHCAPLADNPQKPTVILVVGVNGTGKTTFCAKLASRLDRDGRSVLLAAGDTFRAAAIEQLEIWSQRLNVQIVRQQPGGDPAAVLFDAVTAAKARGADYVIADTAGRLHTKAPLMEELKKVGRVVERALGRPADDVLLVIDATTGQNAVRQAKLFCQSVPVTGLVVAKTDGTARGGVVITVADELGLPIKFLGTGERARDLVDFQPRAFASALFED